MILAVSYDDGRYHKIYSVAEYLAIGYKGTRKREPMPQTTATGAKDVAALLVYRRQLVAARQVQQDRLSRIVTESDRENVVAHLTRLSFFLNEADAELIRLLQTPLRPHGRRGWCGKAFRE